MVSIQMLAYLDLHCLQKQDIMVSAVDLQTKRSGFEPYAGRDIIHTISTLSSYWRALGGV